MNRRGLVVAGVGAAALAGGLAVRLAVERSGAELEAQADLWHQRWPTPQGGELAMTTLRGRPLMINFWATWCPPCVRELPALDRLQREQGPTGWQVLALAVDGAAPVQRFLERTPLALPIVLAGAAGLDWSRRLGNEGGGLPYTVAFSAAGAVLWRHVGEISEAELRRRAVFSTTPPK